MTLPVARLGVGRPAVADYPPGSRFGPRRLVDFELVWLLSGSARWREPDDGRELPLTPGQVLLIPPGTRDEFVWDPVVPTRHGYVHFTMQKIRAGLPWVRSAHPPGPLAGLLEYLVWLSSEPSPDWRERVTEVIGLVVRLMVAGPLPDAGREPAAVAAALAHVRRVWAGGMRAVPLDELAEAASVSKAHLSRQFTRTFGLGAVSALEQVRLARAGTLLSRSTMTVTEVAATCGFHDPLHFSRRFRAAYGRSPRAHRARGTEPTGPAAAGLRRLASRLDPALPFTEPAVGTGRRAGAGRG